MTKSQIFIKTFSRRYVLVYSINSQKSFEVVQVILTGVGIFTQGNDFDGLQVLYDKIADLVGNPRVPVVLVGNKKDLEVKKYNIYSLQYKNLLFFFVSESNPSLI